MELINKKHEQQLRDKLAGSNVYEHYKGKRYRIVGVGRHSEDLSLYVMYEALYDCGDFGQVWIRPLQMFLEDIEIEGVKVPRFKKID